QPTSLLLEALSQGGYLRRSGDIYRLAPQAKKWLVKSSPHYIGNFIAYLEILHSHWGYLESTIRNGKPPSTYFETFTENEWAVYTAGMNDLAKLIIPHVLPKIAIPPKAVSLLDVGGSHGLYSIKLVEKHPNLHAVIADVPEVLVHTKKNISDANLGSRISVQPCEVTTTEFPKNSYDVILLFNLIHGLTEDANRNLLHTLVKSLKDGGTIYILDQFKTDKQSGMKSFLPLMVGLNLLNETGGRVYSVDEVNGWCAAEGLRNISFRKLRLPGVGLMRLLAS
ncbi:MAG TPA: class I SAM-dependent methyltransferase, partial [Bacteroidota bacterium]|nr:class I SAM-dependent methyltransferase [Bacteroidota bacterium]